MKEVKEVRALFMPAGGKLEFLPLQGGG